MNLIEQLLEWAQYALAAIVVLFALNHRRALSFPPWAREPGPEASRSRTGDMVRVVLVTIFMVVLGGIPTLIEHFTQRPAEGFFGPGFLYVAYLLGGWVAGRFGGRYGIACAFWVTIFPVLAWPLSLPLGPFLIADPIKSRVFVERVFEIWWPTLLLTPWALAFTLAAAMLGRWHAVEDRQLEHTDTPSVSEEMGSGETVERGSGGVGE